MESRGGQKFECKQIEGGGEIERKQFEGGRKTLPLQHFTKILPLPRQLFFKCNMSKAY